MKWSVVRFYFSWYTVNNLEINNSVSSKQYIFKFLKFIVSIMTRESFTTIMNDLAVGFTLNNTFTPHFILLEKGSVTVFANLTKKTNFAEVRTQFEYFISTEKQL